MRYLTPLARQRSLAVIVTFKVCPLILMYPCPNFINTETQSQSYLHCCLVGTEEDTSEFSADVVDCEEID